MNTQTCTATGKTPYELVFGQAPRSNFALIKELYGQGIRDEEDIPDNVGIQDNESVSDVIVVDYGNSNNENETDAPDHTPPTSSVLPTNHEELRKLAAENVHKNIERMRAVVENRKRQVTFSVGDLVRINIPRIDRAGIDRRSLPCKVLETLDGGYYRLGCAYGILERCYSAGEMECVSAEFPELENIPNAQISLIKASHLQSSATAVNALCNCKSACNTNRCICKRAGVACSSLR